MSVASRLPQSRRAAGVRGHSPRRGPGAAPWLGARGLRSRFFCCEIGGPRAIVAIENTNKYVAVNVQFC